MAIPATSIVPKFFKRNRGLAQGISVGGSSLGGIIWPITFDQLLNNDSISFSWTMRIVAFIMIPLHVVVILALRAPSKAPQRDDATEKSGGRTNGAEPKAEKSEVRAVLTQPSFILLAIGLAVTYLGFFSPLFFVSRYAVSLGMSQSLAFYLISVVNGASLIGRILPGALADRWGHFNLLTLAALISGLIAFCWTEARSIGGLVVWSLAYGFSSGVSFVSLIVGTVHILTCLAGHHEPPARMCNATDDRCYSRRRSWSSNGSSLSCWSVRYSYQRPAGRTRIPFAVVLRRQHAARRCLHNLCRALVPQSQTTGQGLAPFQYALSDPASNLCRR